jgi:hypothetical protein
VSAAPAWTVAGLLGVAIVLASGRLGGPEPSVPARDSAWKDMSSPQGAPVQPVPGRVACPDASRPSDAVHRSRAGVVTRGPRAA